VKRLLILVEGPTEERFVKLVVSPHLLSRSVIVVPRILLTKRIDSGPNFKGGVTSWNQIKRDLRNLLGDTNAAGITTLIDYYGLPGDVPGMSTRKGSPLARVEHVEKAIAGHFSDRRLRPFLMLHEFEAMLFTNIEKWEHRFDDAAAIARLKNDVAGLEPEGINETPQGAPSKRILRRLREAYEKPFHGPDALNDIGLDAIRDACPHFAAWLIWADSLTADDEEAGGSARADVASATDGTNDLDGKQDDDKTAKSKRRKRRLRSTR
jgi:hypothetical protein